MSAAAKITTSSVDAAQVVSELRATFRTGRTKPIGWRKAQLRRFRDMVKENEDRMAQALKEDLGRPHYEAILAEVHYLLSEAEEAIDAVADWMEPVYTSAPLALQPGTAYIKPEPLGVVLIIAPWNYPIQLALAPLIGAISAGNCAVLKPSEVAPASSKLMAELVPKYLDTQCVRVVEGAVPETTALLEQRWDHIFFTGGERVGKIVMTAAAKHLTPVTLELGGKSPCIVHKSANLKVSARRIIWGKGLNAGQTCIAPDYILVEESIKDRFVGELKAAITDFYGTDTKASPDYSRIVSDRHFDRLVTLMQGGNVLAGGQHDKASRFLALTLIDGVSMDAPLMQEEIFGPLLPIVTVKDMNEAVDIVTSRQKPLALYAFAGDRKTQDFILSNTSSGGVCINDTVQHFLVPGLPFGGVGTSGVGAYHGKFSFDTFSHSKGVLNKPTWVDPSVRYPPYSKGQLKITRFLL
ncbi:MAG: aldehyde dehydrogenase family protein [Deltaproteobacteria bacterium]|nr:aldehyde dehydrogenase family protein [Deltaproteobacteria bacterium]